MKDDTRYPDKFNDISGAVSYQPEIEPRKLNLEKDEDLCELWRQSSGQTSILEHIGRWLDILFSIFTDPESVDMKMQLYGYDNTDHLASWMERPYEFVDAVRNGRDHPDQGKSLPELTKEYFGDVLSSHKYEPARLQAIAELLDFIGDHESALGYDNAFDNERVNLTSMTINEVLAWQDQFVADGSPSSAAGRYQILRGTLRDLIRNEDLSGEELFDRNMQDRLAIALLERRGLSKYLSGEISTDEFMKRLSTEWAALPKDMTGRGYYDGDGLNKANADQNEFRELLENVQNPPPLKPPV